LIQEIPGRMAMEGKGVQAKGGRSADKKETPRRQTRGEVTITPAGGGTPEVVRGKDSRYEVQKRKGEGKGSFRGGGEGRLGRGGKKEKDTWARFLFRREQPNAAACFLAGIPRRAMSWRGGKK